MAQWSGPRDGTGSASSSGTFAADHALAFAQLKANCASLAELAN